MFVLLGDVSFQQASARTHGIWRFCDMVFALLQCGGGLHFNSRFVFAFRRVCQRIGSMLRAYIFVLLAFFANGRVSQFSFSTISIEYSRADFVFRQYLFVVAVIMGKACA